MISLPGPPPKPGPSSTPTDGDAPTLATLEMNDRISTDPAGTVRAARRNLLEFTRFTKRDYLVNWHHRLMARELDRLQRGEITRLIITMPPRHGKSELSTRRLAAYALGQNPDEHVMACSYAKPLASRMNLDVQRIIDTPSYRTLFPATRLPDGRNFRHYVRTADLFEVPGYDGSYRSAGVGGGIGGMGFTLGIVDDPMKNREEANSPTVRQKIKDWWSNDFFPRRQTAARILLTMTRWHRDDLAGWLIKMAQEQDAEQWHVLSLPGIRPTTKTSPDDPRQEGEALWPYFMDAPTHERTKRLDRHAYAALYDQNPGEAGGTEWPASYFGPWIWCEPEQWPNAFQLRIIAVDPSKGKGDKHGDYSAIVFIGVRAGLVYIDASLERRPPHEIVRDTLKMTIKYKPHFLGIEANQFQELLVDEFEHQCGQRFTDQIGIHATPMHNQINKEVRIRRLGGYIVNRDFRFKRDCPGNHLLVDQLMDFPNAEHDDGPDALEMAIRLPSEMGAEV